MLNPMASAYKQLCIKLRGTNSWLMKILHLLGYYLVSDFP